MSAKELEVALCTHLPNTTMHIMTIAVVVHFLTGKAKAELCELAADGGQLCFESRVIMLSCTGDEGCRLSGTA